MRTLRILLVEDNALISLLLAEMLVDLGHEVCAIETTEAGAVAAAAQLRPDLMIVDAQLGEGSGLGAMATIARQDAIPHLFISGDRAGVQARNPGAVSIQKPFYEADLVRAIQHAIALPALKGPPAAAKPPPETPGA
ncbi:response regulator [Nitrospirillum iridis]|uniref:CheY-like chemotaxis protein n=1 Tax=Nitrospirillum iridis TaxID=765888 RepID=A0A7X0AWP3_9PROT|nr:response regulator [Nitrospirillum iridis]MBB6251102.1 CheY-like chemotaxis protein [Nitrospirillum iridis]